MEHKSEIHNAFDSSKNGKVVDDLAKEWRPATSFDGVSRGGKVDDRGPVRNVSFMGGTGYASPGVSRGPIAGQQDGAQYQEADRESSFNNASEADET